MTDNTVPTVPESELIYIPERTLADGLILDADTMSIIIPECCREGWKDCPHVINQPKEPVRRNIAL